MKLDKEGGRCDQEIAGGEGVWRWGCGRGRGAKRREGRNGGGVEWSLTLEDEVEIADADFHTSVPGATEGRQGREDGVKGGRWREE